MSKSQAKKPFKSTSFQGMYIKVRLSCTLKACSITSPNALFPPGDRGHSVPRIYIGNPQYHVASSEFPQHMHRSRVHDLVLPGSITQDLQLLLYNTLKILRVWTAHALLLKHSPTHPHLFQSQHIELEHLVLHGN